MAAPLAQQILLSAHPSTPSEAIGALEVRVQAHTNNTLSLAYRLRADMARIRLPGPSASATQARGRADELWKHTCFEAFITQPGASDYDELNFSPDGQWAAYHFSGYREGMSPLELAVPPGISVRRSPDRVELDARVQLSRPLAGGLLKLALCAVIEEHSGTLRYWAARHPPGQPDFHHRDGYVVELTGGP
ncbi:MAG TPA: DOMON-like domain-containing protein [Steroidobacteraceae bacterium]|jgi:hypothetical protein